MGGLFEAPHLQQIKSQRAALAVGRGMTLRFTNRHEQGMILAEQAGVGRQVRLQERAGSLVG